MKDLLPKPQTRIYMLQLIMQRLREDPTDEHRVHSTPLNARRQTQVDAAKQINKQIKKQIN